MLRKLCKDTRLDLWDSHSVVIPSRRVYKVRFESGPSTNDFIFNGEFEHSVNRIKVFFYLETTGFEKAKAVSMNFMLRASLMNAVLQMAD